MERALLASGFGVKQDENFFVVKDMPTIDVRYLRGVSVIKQVFCHLKERIKTTFKAIFLQSFRSSHKQGMVVKLLKSMGSYAESVIDRYLVYALGDDLAFCKALSIARLPI